VKSVDPDLFITITFVSIALGVALAALVFAYHERRH